MAHVLIAEDDESVRSFVTRALERDGHRVTAVADGRAALEALARQPGGIDLVLADIVMPELDGIALALMLAKDYPDLPILLMTGYAAERQRAHNLEALIHDVVTKPFSLDQICETTRRVLAQHARSTRMH